MFSLGLLRSNYVTQLGMNLPISSSHSRVPRLWPMTWAPKYQRVLSCGARPCNSSMHLRLRLQGFLLQMSCAMATPMGFAAINCFGSVQNKNGICFCAPVKKQRCARWFFEKVLDLVMWMEPVINGPILQSRSQGVENCRHLPPQGSNLPMWDKAFPATKTLHVTSQERYYVSTL